MEGPCPPITVCINSDFLTLCRDLLGGPVLIGWLIASGIAILTLEYVNYIRHWGLRRENGGRFEEGHAWNTEARWSRWSLLELTRHSDHHLHASVPFWKLRPYPRRSQIAIRLLRMLVAMSISPTVEENDERKGPEHLSSRHTSTNSH